MHTAPPTSRRRLEIKRTSITRLKLYRVCRTIYLQCDLKSKEPRLRDWNMQITVQNARMRKSLEIKRTSITRLKLQKYWLNGYDPEALKSKEPRLRDWNMINHDTGGFLGGGLKSKEPRLRDWNSPTSIDATQVQFTWNQKNLDYEIETNDPLSDNCLLANLEIKRTSITRLKPKVFCRTTPTTRDLKSKEPRLRDWN